MPRVRTPHTYPHTPHIEQYYSSPAHQLRRSQNSRSARASKRSYHLRSACLSLPRPASDARGTAQLEGALSGHTATTSATPGLYVGSRRSSQRGRAIPMWVQGRWLVRLGLVAAATADEKSLAAFCLGGVSAVDHLEGRVVGPSPATHAIQTVLKAGETVSRVLAPATVFHAL